MITGTTKNSRLNELKKYKITNIFSEKYIGNGSYVNDGVDFNNSISGVTVVYYIGGIKFVDNEANSITTIILHYNMQERFARGKFLPLARAAQARIAGVQ